MNLGQFSCFKLARTFLAVRAGKTKRSLTILVSTPPQSIAYSKATRSSSSSNASSASLAMLLSISRPECVFFVMCRKYNSRCRVCEESAAHQRSRDGCSSEHFRFPSSSLPHHSAWAPFLYLLPLLLPHRIRSAGLCQGLCEERVDRVKEVSARHCFLLYFRILLLRHPLVFDQDSGLLHLR